MPTLADIRKKYPQYNDLSDKELAEGFHRKFYSDLPFDEFATKVGYEEPGVLGTLAEIPKGLGAGAAGLLESAAIGASAILPEEQERAARAKIQELAAPVREALAPAQGYEEGVVRKGAEALGSTLPFFVLRPLGIAGRVAGAGLGMGAGAGEARTRAELGGATEGAGAAATGLGAIIGLSEMYAPGVSQAITGTIKRALVTGGLEGAQEAASQAAQNLVAKGLYDPNQPILIGTGEAGAYGAGVGALSQALVDFALGRRTRGAVTGAPEEKSQEPTQLPLPGIPAAETAAPPAGQLELPMEMPEAARPEVSEAQMDLFGGRTTTVPASEPIQEEMQFDQFPIPEPIKPVTPVEPIAEPTIRKPTEPTTPATLPTQIPADKEGLRAFGKTFGIGFTAKILREDGPLAGKDITDPAQAAEVKTILEAYASGKPAEGAADKIGEFLARTEFQTPITEPVATEVESEAGGAGPEGTVPTEEPANQGATELVDARVDGPSLRPTEPPRGKGGSDAALSPDQQAAIDLIAAVDKGGIPLNPAKINKIARDLGIEVNRSAKPEDTINRIREAVARITPPPIVTPIAEAAPKAAKKAAPAQAAPDVDPRRAAIETERTRLKRSALTAYDSDVISDKQYEAVQNELKKPAFSAERVSKLMNGDIKPPSTRAVERNQNIAYSGYTAPRQQEETTPRVQVTRRLQGLVNKLNKGKLSETQLNMEIRFLTAQMREGLAVKTAKTESRERERGADIVREKLLAARRRGELEYEDVEFALWALQKNPALAEGLGITIRAPSEQYEGIAGDYNPTTSVIRLFKGAAQFGTAVHEILHHTERMMPADVQAGIMGVWSKQYTKALAKSSGRVRELLSKMPAAMLGDEQAQKDLAQAYKDRTLDYAKHYQLTNPSEFWAVNATDILKGRYGAQNWLGKAKQWVKEFIEKAKELFGIASNAPVLKGLDQVLKGDGARVSDLGLMTAVLAKAKKQGRIGKKTNTLQNILATGPAPQATFYAKAVDSVLDTVDKLPEPTKQVVDRTLSALSAAGAGFKKGWIALQSFYHLEDAYGKWLPIGPLVRYIEKRASETSKILAADEKTLFNYKQAVNKHPKLEQAWRALFGDVTLYQIGPWEADSKKLVADIQSGARTQASLTPYEKKQYEVTKRFLALPKELQDTMQSIYADYEKRGEAAKQAAFRFLPPSVKEAFEKRFEATRLKYWAPLRRRGNYILTYLDKDGNYWSQRFESEYLRKRAIRDAQKLGATQINTSMNVREARTKGQLPAGFTADVLKAVEDSFPPNASADYKQQVLDNIYETYMDYVPSESLKQSTRGRTKFDVDGVTQIGVLGFDPDVLGTYEKYMAQSAYQMKNLEYAPLVDKAMTTLRDKVTELSSAPPQGVSSTDFADVLESIEGRVKFAANPTYADIVMLASKTNYVFSIAANVSTAIFNTTVLPTMAYSEMMAVHGPVKTYKAMQTAMGKFVRSGRDATGNYTYANKATGEHAELFKALEERGVLGIAAEQELRQAQSIKVKGYEGLSDKIGYYTSFMFRTTERFNREVVALSAFQLVRDKGGSVEEAIQYAVDVNNRVNGPTLPELQSRLYQSNIGRIMLTFKTFVVNHMIHISRVFHAALKGESPEVRAQARKKLLGIYATTYMFAGIKGLPFFGAAEILANLLMGDDDEPYDAQQELLESVKTLGTDGPVAEMLNIATASRTGYADVLWRDDPKRLAEVGLPTFVLEKSLGPTWGLLLNYKRGFDEIGNGNLDRAMEAFTPAAARNVLKSLRYATEGVLDKNGNPIADDVSAYNTFMQAFGFAPQDLSIIQAQRGAKYEIDKKLRERRTALLTQRHAAKIAGDWEALAEINEAMIKFSRANPSIRIDNDTLKRSDAQHKRQRELMESGTYLPKKRAIAASKYVTLTEEELEELED